VIATCSGSATRTASGRPLAGFSAASPS
jgi:hypothetical protein